MRAQGQIPRICCHINCKSLPAIRARVIQQNSSKLSCIINLLIPARLKTQSYETLPEDSHVLRKEQTTAHCSGAHLLSRMSNRIMILTPNSATRTNQEPRRHPPCISSTQNNRVHISHPVAIDTELNQPNIFFFIFHTNDAQHCGMLVPTPCCLMQTRLRQTQHHGSRAPRFGL